MPVRPGGVTSSQVAPPSEVRSTAPVLAEASAQPVEASGKLMRRRDDSAGEAGAAWVGRGVGGTEVGVAAGCERLQAAKARMRIARMSRVLFFILTPLRGRVYRKNIETR